MLSWELGRSIADQRSTLFMIWDDTKTFPTFALHQHKHDSVKRGISITDMSVCMCIGMII